VEQLSYDAIRGRNKGAEWPASSEVDDDSFFGKFRAKTGKAFDLPTEAQWEYACRAGTITALNNGTNITNEFDDGNMFKLGRVYRNMKDGKGGYEYTTVVGCYLPNAWGLYDMHGNALEYCLDWYSENMAADPVTDPKGPETGFYRILRGGSYYFYPKESRSAYRSRRSRTDNYNNDSGIRVVLVLE
jgi:formylglycine-generating enzyme required for sulfatase activity